MSSPFILKSRAVFCYGAGRDRRVAIYHWTVKPMEASSRLAEAPRLAKPSLNYGGKMKNE